MSCACGNSPSLAKCCGPFIQGEAFPPTAEALMRARYTAYTLKEVDYVLDTCDPDAPAKPIETPPRPGRKNPSGWDSKW